MNNCNSILILFLFFIPIYLSSETINILDRGAKGDGIKDNTVIIQKAIDDCSKTGGGTVYVPSGTYLIRPLEFKSNVELYIEFGATLLGSNKLADYDKAFPISKRNMNQSSGLIWGKNLNNISIRGLGSIDGQGGDHNFQFGNNSEEGPVRPKLIYFVDCKQIRIENITLRNSAYWVQHYEKCENVIIKGIKVFSHCNYNNDGLDIDGKNFIISDCYIDVEDDAICLKSDHSEFCEDITVANCITASNCNAIKLGTASNGGFRNIAISNCTIHRAAEDNIRHWNKQLEYISEDVTVISGVAIEMVDGGIIDGVTVSNITMRDVQTPIFIKLGDRKRTFRKEMGILKNVNIDNIVATAESLIPSSITGVEDNYIENVSISNVQINYPGGGTEDMTKKLVPENSKKYPENRMFGNILPGAGFYVRHVKDIRFNNVRITGLKQDARPLFYFDDVVGAQIYLSNNKLINNKLIYQTNCFNISFQGDLTESNEK